jgi:general stress protein YciG
VGSSDLYRAARRTPRTRRPKRQLEHRGIDNDRLQEATKVNSTERKERRGFASMSPERQKEIASKGGRAAHAKGTAHEWTPEEARSAGRKGGQVSRGGRGRLPSDPVGVEAPFQNE